MVERTETKIISAPFFQVNILCNYLQNVGSIIDTFNNIPGNPAHLFNLFAGIDECVFLASSILFDPVLENLFTLVQVIF